MKRMFAKGRPPQVQVRPDSAAIGGGMNTTVPPIFAKPGTARLAYNYEYAVNGGAERIGGIEPFDGQTAPSSASYVYLQCSAAISGIALGDVVDGATSGASGTAIYISGAFIALTRVTGAFTTEDLEVSAVVKATVSNASPAIDGFVENIIFKAAADEYQADIAKVPGSGPIRGLAVLNDIVYAWRDNVGATAMAIYKSSGSGWTAVALLEQVSFTGGSSEYTEGETLTQGGASAAIARVVLESGTWGAGTAAGRFIISGRSGGNFSAGASGGGGVATLSGAQTAITLSPGGRVRTDAYTFTAQLADKRLYGCDGVNAEFEFDGTVLVPISTGMGSIRATSVRCHKQHLFFGYRGSLQHSSIGNPYVWSAVFGAGELGTGDEITNLISVGGATAAAAMFATCRNALFVLYGTSSADWDLQPLSRVSGAQAHSAQDIGGVVAMDAPGVVRYPATQDFGNFAWDTVSMDIQSIARGKETVCSVFVTDKFKYRIFFDDGTAISGLPLDKRKFAWSVINYGRNIVVAEHAEIDNVSRTFYGDDDGWVYEADKGRSFAGETIDYTLKLQPMSQRSPMMEKSYHDAQLELQTQSACTIYTSAEFGSSDADGPEGATEEQTTEQYGSGLVFDLSNLDQSYWGTASVGRKMVPVEGDGTNVALTIAGSADNELPHTLFSATVFYIARKVTT